MPYITPESISKTCDETKELLLKKNQAYGNSFENIIIQNGLHNALARLNDKFSRLTTLMSSESISDNGESIIETVDDIIGYGTLIKSYVEPYEQHLIKKYIQDYEDAKVIPCCDLCGHQLNELACPTHGIRAINKIAIDYAKKVIISELRGLIKPDYEIVKKIDTESNSNFIYRSYKDSVLVPSDNESYVTITSVDKDGHVLVDCLSVTNDSKINAVWNVDEKKLEIRDRDQVACTVPLLSIKKTNKSINDTIIEIETEIQKGNNIDLRKYI